MVFSGVVNVAMLLIDVIGRLSVNPRVFGYEEPNVFARFREFVAQKCPLVSKSKVPFCRSLAFFLKDTKQRTSKTS